MPLTPEDLAFSEEDRALPGDKDDFFRPLNELTIEPPPLAAVAESFRSNLTAARSLLLVPVTLSTSTLATVERERVALEFVERLKALERDHRRNAISDDRYKEECMGALRRFTDPMKQETKDLGKHSEQFMSTVFNAALKVPGYENSLETLFAQTLVLVWSAVEVLSNDLLVAIVNAYPSLATQLVKCRGFDQVKFDLDGLIEYNFDLSHQLGSYIGRRLKLDTVEAMKDVFPILFKHEEANLSRMLKNPDLRLLSKRRNLIVHRRGIVDRRYREETSETLALGVTLLVTPKDVRDSLYTARDVGVALLRAAITHQSTAES